MPMPEGFPVWFELNAPDPEVARTFYEAVMGWRIAPSPMPEHGGYRIAETEGKPVAGIRRPMAQESGPLGWAVYLATGDVDAACARVAELGGHVRFGPMDIPHVGRFAVVSDPQGVVFALMTVASPGESAAFKPMPLGSQATLGQGVWIELATPDPGAALAFYGALFGWEKVGAMPMGGMGEYAFVGRDEFRPGAVMSSTATGAPPRWSWYVHVPDIDAALATVRAEGGTVLQGPDPIPGGSYSAKIADPAGAGLGLAGMRRDA